MDWKSINLYIENFIPGVILLAEILFLWDWKQFVPIQFSSGGAIEATIFIATSYGVGVLSSVVSRWLIDSLSEIGPCALVFSWQTHWKVKDLEKLLKDDTHFVSDLQRENEHRFRGEKVKLWNAVYRGVLRGVSNSKDKKAKEAVSRRREQGRLGRNMIFPFIMTIAYISKVNWHLVDWQVFLIAVGSLVPGIFLYAYAELNNFTEAADISYPAF